MPRLSAETSHLKQRLQELEEELSRSRKREMDIRTLVENSPDILYRTDLNGYITYISPSAFRLSGYTVAEAIGMHMAKEVYLHAEERESFEISLRHRQWASTSTD